MKQTNPLAKLWDCSDEEAENTRRSLTEQHRSETIARLKHYLPDWHFETYGKPSCCVACFPPDKPCRTRYEELFQLAPIQSVCGPFYVVSECIELNRRSRFPH